MRLNARLTGFPRPATAGGVAVENTDGPLSLMEAKTVILATGGFTADVRRRMAVHPQLIADLRTTANPYGTNWDGATGDALDLGSPWAALKTGFGMQLIPFWGGRLLDYGAGTST